MGHIVPIVKLKSEDRKALESWLRAPTMSQGLALRARILLASDDGEGVRPLAERLEVSPNTVSIWRRRYREEGLAGLQTRSRTGRPRRIGDAKERAIVSATMRPPEEATHWSARRLAKRVAVSSATVHRIWQKHGLQPHRTTIFKFSKDPDFDSKMADIVGLYLDPPERALVLCVDKKSQIQALNRTQPILPMRPGLPARMTHDYKRKGTTSLFAALKGTTGKVHGQCFSRHTHVEFLGFLKSTARKYPKREFHLTCDNYGIQKHPKVKEWVEAHPRFHLHFIPTSSSWLNVVERWFARITDEAIRRGSFDDVRALERNIMKSLEHWNLDAKPFRWTKTPRQIRKCIRRIKATHETGHQVRRLPAPRSFPARWAT